MRPNNVASDAATSSDMACECRHGAEDTVAVDFLLSASFTMGGGAGERDRTVEDDLVVDVDAVAAWLFGKGAGLRVNLELELRVLVNDPVERCEVAVEERRRDMER